MSERWIVARPRGGLNDTLCQMEKCWRFAEKTGRRIVFDTRASGLLLDFHDVFGIKTRPNFLTPHRLTNKLVSALNRLDTFPPDVRGNVVGYRNEKDDKDNFFTLPSKSPLKFPLGHDYAEDVVVYEGMGGGVDSFCVLERLTLAPWLSASISDSLNLLPERYFAVHIRHTDLKTDYHSLLQHVAKKNKAQLPVLIASDNDTVISSARETLGENVAFTLPRYTERPGGPLHNATPDLSEKDRVHKTQEALSELFALSGAEVFFYTEVTARAGVSGFSRLAAHLSSRPALRADLLGSSYRTHESRPSRSVLFAPVHRRVLESVRWWRHRCLRTVDTCHQGSC